MTNVLKFVSLEKNGAMLKRRLFIYVSKYQYFNVGIIVDACFSMPLIYWGYFSVGTLISLL